MKKLILSLNMLLISICMIGQAPQMISYQAVVRDGSNELIANSVVRIQVSILQGSISGTAIYTEEQAPLTNSNGLFTIDIGTGISSDDFSSIDWSDGPYYIKTEIDPTGGTDYTLSNTSQLLSVPYALYAEKAAQADETDPIYTTSAAGGITAEDIINWNSWSGFSGNYNDLTNKPNIPDSIETYGFSGDYDDLVNLPTTLSEFTNDVGYLIDEVDGSITNEIQDLQISENILQITGNAEASEIDLSVYLDNTDTHLSETEVDEYVANNGYLTEEVDGSESNEIQDLQLSDNILTITNNPEATEVDLGVYLDTAMWKKEGMNLYYNKGYVSIGTSGPGTTALTLSKSMNSNDASASQHDTQFKILNTNGNKALSIGLLDNGTGFIQANEVNVGYQDLLVNPLAGKVGIGTTAPARTLHIKDVLRLEPRGDEPDNPSAGDIYFDGVLHKLRVYDGTTWQNCW